MKNLTLRNVVLNSAVVALALVLASGCGDKDKEADAMKLQLVKQNADQQVRTAEMKASFDKTTAELKDKVDTAEDRNTCLLNAGNDADKKALCMSFGK